MKLSENALKINKTVTYKNSEQIYSLIKEGKDIINLSMSEPDFSTPCYIKERAIETIKEDLVSYTPGSGLTELKRAICEKLLRDNNLSYEPEQIVISNGNKQSLLNIFLTILNNGDEVIVPSPYWLTYPEIIKIAGGEPRIVKTKKQNCYKIRLNELEEVLTDKTKAIIINTPSNPSGMVYSLDELKDIVDFAVKNDLFIISDELYEKFIYSDSNKHISPASVSSQAYERVILVNGMTKTYCMTDLRLSYIAGNRDIISVISSIQSQVTTSANIVSQMAATEALKRDIDEQMLEEFKHRRDYALQRVSDIPLLSVLKPKGGFYLFVDVSKLIGGTIDGFEIKDADDVARILLEKYSVGVLSCREFGFSQHIRISFATDMSNIVKGINRIEKFVKENY